MRSKKIFLNALWDIIPYLLIGIVGLVKVNFLITYIGDVGNGYYQFINQIIAYVFLAQAGFSEAVTYKLYKPFANDEKKDINKIYSGARYIFKKIGILIFGIIVLVCIFLYFFYGFEGGFRNSALICFFVIATSYLIAYFGKTLTFSAVLAAAQERYVYSIVINNMKLICDILIVGAIVVFRSLESLAIVILIIKIIEEIVMRIVVKRKYPWLHEISEKDTSATKMTKDLLWYQVGYLVLNNVDAILLMTFSGAVSVSIYTSYNFVLRYINEITARINTATTPSFGNVFIKDDNKKAYKLFNESRILFLIIGFATTLTFMLGIRSFINVWIGSSTYILSYVTIVLFSLTLFLNVLYYPLLSIVTANGLFKENKYHIFICAGINVILSVILVNFYGINGVLFATVIALFVNIILKSYLITKKTFKVGLFEFLRQYLVAFVIFIIIAIIFSKIELFIFGIVSNFIMCLLVLIVLFGLLTVMVFFIMVLINRDTLSILSRVKRILKRS